jgi:hypothetical protein
LQCERPPLFMAGPAHGRGFSVRTKKRIIASRPAHVNALPITEAYAGAACAEFHEMKRLTAFVRASEVDPDAILRVIPGTIEV